MDANEREDRNAQRWLTFWMTIVIGGCLLGVALGFPAILLSFGQGALLGDVVKIVLGFLGGSGVGAFLIRMRQT